MIYIAELFPAPPLFWKIVNKFPDFSLFMALISHLKSWFDNIHYNDHNILAIYYLSGQVRDLISSITYFL